MVTQTRERTQGGILGEQTAHPTPGRWDRHDVRGRDDILLRSTSGLVVPQSAPASAGVLVGAGARVVGPEGPVGTLERVLVDPDTDEVRALVVARGPLAADTVTLAARAVVSVGPQEVVLR